MEWKRGSSIGRGSSATVYLATALPSGEMFAVKSGELSSSFSLRKEQLLLSKLSSPYLVKCLGFDVSNENRVPMFNLFMEYELGGSLSDEIRRHGGRLDGGLIRSYTRQILLGLDYLHDNGLAHCDIKCENILVGKEGVKIADLGCAKMVEKLNAKASIKGTPAFMAPEVARGEEQGFEADVWALGCTVIEMATGKHPWLDRCCDPVSILHRIGFSGELPLFPSWFSDEGNDFLSKCLKRDSKERWTAKKLLEHPFLDEQSSDSATAKQTPAKFTNSPNGVLEKGIFDSLEISESHLNLTKQSSSTNSPAERINNLVGKLFPVKNFPASWTLNGDWISVRSNIVNKTDDLSSENEVAMIDETASTSTIETSSDIQEEDGEIQELDQNLRTTQIEFADENFNFDVKLESDNEIASATHPLFPPLTLLTAIIKLFEIFKPEGVHGVDKSTVFRPINMLAHYRFTAQINFFINFYFK